MMTHDPFNLIMQIINSFQVFASAFIMTGADRLLHIILYVAFI